MAVIEEQVRVADDTKAETSEPSRPPSSRTGGGLGWFVVGLAVAAAILAVVLAANLGSDTDTPTVGQSPGLVENGSITAVDAAAEAPSVPSPGLVENGSITAVDAAAASGGSAPTGAAGPAGGTHALIVENGSIRAVEHASETGTP